MSTGTNISHFSQTPKQLKSEAWFKVKVSFSLFPVKTLGQTQESAIFSPDVLALAHPSSLQCLWLLPEGVPALPGHPWGWADPWAPGE